MSKEKRFAFTGKCLVEIQEFDSLRPGAREVAVKNVVSMVSPGTEGIVFCRAFTEGNHWDNWVKYPFFPGYSAAGYVTAVGSEVTKVKVGDRVVTRSSHASAVVKDENQCYLIPDDLSFENALWFAFAKITGIGARAAQYKLGDHVAVIGAGVIGQLSARWAYAAGAAKVIVIDPAKDRLNYLKNAGSFVTLSEPVGKCYDTLTELCGGTLPGIVVEATGNARVFQDALKAVGRFGKLVLMTDTGTPEDQRLCGEVITRGLTIVGAHDPQERADWNEGIITSLFFNMCLDGRIRMDNMISHRFSHQDPATIYRVCMEERNSIMGVIINWEE